MNVAKDEFGGAINEVKMVNGTPALQLARLGVMGDVMRSALDKRIKGKRLTVDADWRKLLDAHLKAQGGPRSDDLEESARSEKTAALKELGESRLSVLIGPAGTGKTTLLSVLCSHPAVAAGGVLLLAPTGKARGADGAIHEGPSHHRLHDRSVPQPASLRHGDRAVSAFGQASRG